MARYSWFVYVVLVLAFCYSASSERSKRSTCVGPFCPMKEDGNKSIHILDDHCTILCNGQAKHAYQDVCDCDKLVTTKKPPCQTTYLQNTLCQWRRDHCDTTATSFCTWRREEASKLLATFNVGTCSCEHKQETAEDPCKWSEDEKTLCAVMKDKGLLYSNYRCQCKVDHPTAPPGDTNVCEYTKYRSAELTHKRRKRFYDGKTVGVFCNYPGVVGLFHFRGLIRSVCTASLLDKETLLIDEQCKSAITEKTFALLDSHNARAVNLNSPTVDKSSITPVDPTSAVNLLYTIKLTTPLPAFNDRCTVPACIANARTPAAYINFKDCRVLGYGDTTDTIVTGAQSEQLQEIKVEVDTTSLASGTLNVTRLDTVRNTACMNDFSAPLVCPYKYSSEWITVGIHTNVGTVCSGALHPFQYKIANLLSDSKGNRYFNMLSRYHPEAARELLT